MKPRRNQKGQVAIFVALIFQVIFIFFALLINVGLLVHHKINLQQSADLAAYYGAMKQAEQLNAMAHVNYQMKQNWKLLTWRYRILGTFGNTAIVDQNKPGMHLPISAIKESPKVYGYNKSAENIRLSCKPNEFLNTAFPLFCTAHAGFGGWQSIKDETLCKDSCDSIESGVNQTVKSISLTSGATVPGANLGGVINTVLGAVNDEIKKKCDESALFTAKTLATYLQTYNNEADAKRKVIAAIADNLSRAAEDILDLEGNSIFKGAEKTFKNNLTDANLNASDLKFETFNSLSSDQCKIFKKIIMSKLFPLVGIPPQMGFYLKLE